MGILKKREQLLLDPLVEPHKTSAVAQRRVAGRRDATGHRRRWCCQSLLGRLVQERVSASLPWLGHEAVRTAITRCRRFPLAQRVIRFQRQPWLRPPLVTFRPGARGDRLAVT